MAMLTAEERAAELAEKIANAEGAGRLLAALIPALNAAESSDHIDPAVRNTVRRRVDELMTAVALYAENFAAAT